MVNKRLKLLFYQIVGWEKKAIQVQKIKDKKKASPLKVGANGQKNVMIIPLS